MHKLILASESPRRKTLLEEAGFSFRVFSVKVSENIEKNLNTETEINAEIQKIALTKAQAVFATYKPLESGNYLILSADTLVILGHRPLGKPKSSTEAEEFLSLLSNRTHQVKTAICLFEAKLENQTWTQGRIIERIETTDVTFRPILRQEILDYVATGEPMDKAGAYAIQGLGKKFVSHFSGDYDSVVGLPVKLLISTLAENNFEISRSSAFKKIQTEIQNLAANPNAKLLAVSKLQSIEKIQALLEQGQIHFGENYVQEALTKQQALSSSKIQWHFIGHLQKNKVKMIVGKFALIHSVDSVELARKISQVASQLNVDQNILLQVNLANEESKGGLSEQEFCNSIDELKLLPHLKVTGLMTMPPLATEPELSRPYFRRLKQLASQFELSELSMGTSADYQVALEEGATWVRLGTVIFGERPHKTL